MSRIEECGQKLCPETPLCSITTKMTTFPLVLKLSQFIIFLAVVLFPVLVTYTYVSPRFFARYGLHPGGAGFQLLYSLLFALALCGMALLFAAFIRFVVTRTVKILVTPEKVVILSKWLYRDIHRSRIASVRYMTTIRNLTFLKKLALLFFFGALIGEIYLFWKEPSWDRIAAYNHPLAHFYNVYAALTAILLYLLSEVTSYYYGITGFSGETYVMPNIDSSDSYRTLVRAISWGRAPENSRTRHGTVSARNISRSQHNGILATVALVCGLVTAFSPPVSAVNQFNHGHPIIGFLLIGGCILAYSFIGGLFLFYEFFKKSVAVGDRAFSVNRHVLFLDSNKEPRLEINETEVFFFRAMGQALYNRNRRVILPILHLIAMLATTVLLLALLQKPLRQQVLVLFGFPFNILLIWFTRALIDFFAIDNRFGFSLSNGRRCKLFPQQVEFVVATRRCAARFFRA